MLNEFRRFRPWLLAGGITAALLVAAAALGAFAWASIPDGSGVVHACFQSVRSADKPVKLLDTAKSANCPSGWKPVSWNVQGQPGTQGPPGVSDYTTASTTITFDNQHGNPTGTANCSAGTVPISGGFDASTDNIPQDWSVSESAPVFSLDGTGKVVGGGWKVSLSSVANPSSGGKFTVSVICAAQSG